MDQVLGSLDDKPRARLGHTPTPLEEMANLAAQIGGGPLYVKRDDCTGLALGGNKVRQLEFYLGEAQEAHADTIFTQAENRLHTQKAILNWLAN